MAEKCPVKKCLSLDETLECIFSYLDNPRDRGAVSRVCKQWHQVDGNTRKYVYVGNCYSIAPSALSKRFKNLKKLKLKGKPRAVEYDLLEDDWGGYAGPWVREIVKAYPRLQALHLRRMEVFDEDLEALATGCGAALQVLKLHKCSGFSTAGLGFISHSCRSLRVLYLEESEIMDEGGQWLWELGQNNPSLQSLNIVSTGLDEVGVVDAVRSLVQKCKALISLKVSEIEVEKLKEVLKLCVMPLEELGAGCHSIFEDHKAVARSLLPWVSRLKILDLKFTLLNEEAHCQLLTSCFSLEELEVRSVVGDRGLEVIGRTCSRLKRLRVDQDGSCFISQRGLTAIAEGCRELQFLVMYLSNITNAALAAVGQYLTNLTDFRIVLLRTLEVVEDLPLDDGVRLLLRGCQKLTRFSVYLRHGGLTNRGLAYIGEFGERLTWILLGCSGEGDQGLADLAQGCQRLERLELRDCPFGEAALSNAWESMKSLKYLWVQGYGATAAVGQSLLMEHKSRVEDHQFLHVEVMPNTKQLLAYYSLASPRVDCPPTVQVLSSTSIQSITLPGAEFPGTLDVQGGF